jgi:hypothetical protein
VFFTEYVPRILRSLQKLDYSSTPSLVTRGIYETILLRLTSGHGSCYYLTKTTLSPLSVLIMSLRLCLAERNATHSDTSPSFRCPPQRFRSAPLVPPTPHTRNSDAMWATPQLTVTRAGRAEVEQQRSPKATLVIQVLSCVMWTGEVPKSRSIVRAMDILTTIIIHRTKISIVHWNAKSSKLLSNYLVNSTQRIHSKEANSCSATQKFPPFYETEGLLHCSQEHVNGLYPK